MRKSSPVDFAIRVEMWADAPGWSIDEICWLALGYDPKRVMRKGVTPELSEEQRSLVQEVQDVLDVYFDGTEQSRRPSPQKAKDLLSRAGVQLPGRLAEAVEQRERAEAPRERPSNATTKELNSLKKILIAVAVDKFDYKPDMRSGAARQISDVTVRKGIPVDEGTVRKFLKETWLELGQVEKDILLDRDGKS